MATEYQERYERQRLIKDWDQKKLTNSRVVIVGHDNLGEFVNLGLAALGIGEIRIITNKKERKEEGLLSRFKVYTKYKGNEKAKIYAHILKKINPTINVIDINTEIFNENYFRLLNNPKLVIDATNNPESKLLCQKFCIGNKVPFISVAAGLVYGLVDVNPTEDKLKEQFTLKDQNQNLIVSEILAGFVVDEARKMLLPLNNEKKCQKTLRYNLISEERF